MISPALAGLAGACCVGVGLRGVVLMRSASAIERRELQADMGQGLRRRGPTRRLVDLLGARLGPLLLARMSDSGRAAIVRRIDLAGRPGGLNVERYAELKAAVLALALALAVFFLLLGSWPSSVCMLLLGWIGVDIWLRRTGRHRQERLERDLPDFIEILSITVRAGTGYRAALDRVSTSLAGPPAEEIRLTLRQMDLGATRREAFQALRERNDSRTLDNFVSAQLQAEELGVPLADSLANIASDTRRAAAQAARRRAQRATPRVSLIAISVLVPATILLIIAALLIGTGISATHPLG